MSNNQGFIDESVFSGKIPGTGAPLGMQQSPEASQTMSNDINPEYLDMMINNPKEHPEIRKQAAEMKKKLFGDVEEVSEEVVVEESKPKPKRKAKSKKKSTSKPKKVVPEIETVGDIEEAQSPIPSKQITKNEFSNFIKSFKSDQLYADSIALPSNPDVQIQLKSMTVEEYKFLTRQLEVFESKITDIDPEMELLDRRRKIQTYEFGLNTALDTLLKRCVVSQINIDALTIYDWVYILLYLRLISRGEECKFKIRKQEDGEVSESYIDFSLNELLDYLMENREYYCPKIIENVQVNDEISLCIMPITRGEYGFIQKEYMKDKNASLTILSAALSCKAFIQDGVANIMSAPQRVELTNNLPYEVIQNVMNCFDSNNEKFFELINKFIRDKNENAEDVNLSDFLLFFYDF